MTGTTLPFSRNVTGLTEGQSYNFAAYAKNSVGTSYGDTITFTIKSRIGVTTNTANTFSSGEIVTGATSGVTATLVNLPTSGNVLYVYKTTEDATLS